MGKSRLELCSVRIIKAVRHQVLASDIVLKTLTHKQVQQLLKIASTCTKERTIRLLNCFSQKSPSAIGCQAPLFNHNGDI